ncbi:early nodulin-like protein 18 [Phragmites australis]|uniref:early nodulin-like protein 18 n=1 Tax=Phragmites australis TaxID=29695 RepID=UPI002D78D2FE|nr:early nodulin-like protein 18 [Phragmites australis]
MARHLRSAAAAVAAVAVVVAAVLASPAAAQGATPAADDAPPYRNHTVGGADGWFFNAKTNTTSGNYSSWAAGETFYIGDYLIFKTNANSSVVQTANSTSYALCDPSEEDPSPTTFIYGGGGGGGGGAVEEADTLAVPLTFKGENYFFSEADGGVQCQQGMRFEIKVAHGRGLPPALAHPPPPPKERVLAPPPAGTAFSGIGTIEPGDGAGDNGGEGRSGAAAVGSRFLGVAFGMALAAFVAA